MTDFGSDTIIASSTTVGVIDTEANIDGEIVNIDGAPCDVMLVLIDEERGTDMFYVLQLIHTSCDWVIFSRFGKTGRTGNKSLQHFGDLDEAFDSFRQMFLQASGLDWKDREKAEISGKYRFLRQDFDQKRLGYTGAVWQYWVDDFVDGKQTGWYDYDPNGSAEVERLYWEYSTNPEFSERWIDSGIWTYNVNLKNMTQTNVQHPNHKCRLIRRNTSKALRIEKNSVMPEIRKLRIEEME